MSSAVEKRRAEIELKKAKLAELRRQREERASLSSTPALPVTPSRFIQRKEVDDLVNALVGDGLRSARSGRPASRGSQHGVLLPGTSISEAGASKEPSLESRPNSVSLEQNINVEILDAGVQKIQEEGVAPIESTVESAARQVSHLQTQVESLGLHTPQPVVVKVETYSKGVQTQVDETENSYQEEEVVALGETQEQLIERLRAEIEAEQQAKLLESVRTKTKTELVNPISPELTEHDKSSLLSKPDFSAFVERSTRIIERALNEDYDILIDYGRAHEATTNDETASGRRLKELVQFANAQSMKRMITSTDWSPKFPELVLASYNKNITAPHEADGTVNVWNMHSPNRPEFTFSAQSDVLTARFSPFHPNLIVGGSYSGQVMLWDTRAKQSPVLKTPITGRGHTHPIYGTAIVGTQNANNIISTSTDGTVCAWSIDMLAQPQEVLELVSPPPSKIDDLVITGLSFPQADPTTFLVGTEEGALYPIHRYDRAGAKAGVDPRVSYRGHTGAVTGLDHHPAKGPVDLGDLVLSSSLDWTIKLWKVKPPAPSSNVLDQMNHQSYMVAPLMTFTREDMIYDVKWSPVKPGVWASVDGAGTLEVWDIATNSETPIAKATPSTERSISRSLNKLAWDREGQRIAVGGLNGILTVFDVGTLGGQDVKNEDFYKVAKLSKA